MWSLLQQIVSHSRSHNVYKPRIRRSIVWLNKSCESASAHQLRVHDPLSEDYGWLDCIASLPKTNVSAGGGELTTRLLSQ